MNDLDPQGASSSSSTWYCWHQNLRFFTYQHKPLLVYSMIFRELHLVPMQLYIVHQKLHCTLALLDECLCHSNHTMTPMRFYTNLAKLVSFFKTLDFEKTSFC